MIMKNNEATKNDTHAKQRGLLVDRGSLTRAARGSRRHAAVLAALVALAVGQSRARAEPPAPPPPAKKAGVAAIPAKKAVAATPPPPAWKSNTSAREQMSLVMSGFQVHGLRALGGGIRLMKRGSSRLGS